MSLSHAKPPQKINGMEYHVLRTSLNRFGKSPLELDPPQLKEVQDQAKKAYELERLVIESDEGRDVHVPDSVLNNAVKSVIEQYEDEKSFRNDLNTNNIDYEMFCTAIRRELHVESILEKVGSRAAKITEIDCMIYYFMHKAKFEQPETRTVRHILVTINDDYQENERETARKRMEDVLQRVRKKPKRFDEQALKHSECPTAMNGGLLGKIPKGQLYPELDEVLFSMKEGEVSDIVESPIGFHILYCEKVRLAGPVSFKEAEQRVIEKLQSRRKRMCQRNWVADQRDRKKNKEINRNGDT